MGVNSSNSSGFSSGNTSFQSSPQNLQLQPFTNLAGPTAQGIQRAQLGNSYGVAGNQDGNWLSPYAGTYGNFNDTSTNPLVAPTTGQQNYLLGNVAGWASPQNALSGQAFGNMANASQFANANPLGNAMGAAGNMLSPNYAANLASSPQTQSAIQSAVQPMINSFNSQTVPGLQGMFTAAGQRINTSQGTGMGSPGGSSAFDQAGANAMTGLEGQIGATAGGIANQAYQTGLGQQSQAINQSGNLVAEQLSNLLGVAQGSQGIVTGQLNNTINALNASALPQLTQQYGINQGLQLYQNQVNTLMTSLGLGGQVAQPALGNSSSGTGSSAGNSKSSGKGISL